MSALSFSVFLAPYNVVSGGTSGLGLMVQELFGIDVSIFVFCASFFLMLVGGVFLGWDMALKTCLGIILYPIFVKATGVFVALINFEKTGMMTLMVVGGALSGFANGIILKTGFSLGGLQTLVQIVSKYLKVSYGKANMVINMVVIVMGSYIFGIANIFYALITVYVASLVTDRLLLGTSAAKAFYVVTTKDKEVRDFLALHLNHSVTLLEVRGGYGLEKKKMILSVIPTREYFYVKKVIWELDKEAFFLITDAYEVQGGL